RWRRRCWLDSFRPLRQIGLAEGRGSHRDLELDLVALVHARLGERDVLHVDRPLELADVVEELGELEIAALELERDGDAHVELTGLLGTRLDTLDAEPRELGRLVEALEEDGHLGLLREHLLELAILDLALGELLLEREEGALLGLGA